MFCKMLDGVRVVEYGNLISASFCAKILADLGAEVIKIEEPDHGDEARRREPFLDDIPGLERSGLFLYLNMNKLGVTLNLKTTTGKKIFADLLRDANIIVENNPPKVMEELGISYENVKEITPGIIMTSITPFGQTGPYKDYKGGELISTHMGGVGNASTRETDISQEPIKLVANLFTFQAGLCAAVVTMGALYHQSLTGLGEQLDISVQDSVVQNLDMQIYMYSISKQIVARTDRINRAPWHVIPCKDGYIYHAFLQEQQWRRFVEVMGNPDWADIELFKDYATRGENWDALRLLLTEWTMQHTVEEIYRASQERSAPVGAVYTAKDILNSKQMASRGFIAEVEHPECGRLKYPSVPYVSSEIPREAPNPAPLLGQHNEEIYCGRLGYTKHDLVKFREAGVI